MKQLHDLMIEGELTEITTILENFADKYAEFMISESENKKTMLEYTIWADHGDGWEKIVTESDFNSIKQKYNTLKEEKESKFKVTKKKVSRVDEARERKTEDVYILQGYYGQYWEDISSSNSLKEIKDNLKEYRENEGGRYKIIKKRIKKPVNEGVTDIPDGTLEDMFTDAVRRLEAARKGLGLTNKLPPGPSRQQHRARILGNLNRLRALVDRMVKMADSESFKLQHQQRFDGNRNASI